MIEGHILIVDDERSLREFLEIFLRKEGYDVTTSAGGEETIERLNAGDEYDVVLTDLMMPGVNGIEVLEQVKERFPDTQVLMMTAYATADTAIEAMKKGAFDYIQKPFKNDEIRVVIDKALHQRRLVQENRQLRLEVHQRYSFHNIIGRSPPMQRVFDVISRVADTRTSVLITGESGTGKELIAKALHHNSSRKDAAMITVNCGAIPENLMESELFGHVKGSFTGAHSNKTGLFAAADGGSIFLDEVGEMPLQTQVKLLRVLQERKIRQVGANAEVSIDVRVMAATNQDLEQAVRDGRFREDLYYRLNVVRIEIPALRDRRPDVPLIAQHFLKRFCDEMGKDVTGFTPEAMKVVGYYDYPGNVRELENLVERAVTFENSDQVTVESLPPRMLGGTEDPGGSMTTLELPESGMDLESVLSRVERNLLSQALERTGGHRTEAAKLLGISFRSIRYKLEKYSIVVDDVDGT